jgi:hypothetical protein
MSDKPAAGQVSWDHPLAKDFALGEGFTVGDVAIAMSAIRAKDVMTFFVAECETGRPLFVAGSTDKALGLSPDQLIGDPRGALRLLGAEMARSMTPCGSWCGSAGPS